MVRAAIVGLVLVANSTAQADAGMWRQEFTNGDVYTVHANRVNWLNSSKRVWVEGYHRANKSVPHRASSQLLEFDCGGYVSVLKYVTYDANGSQMSSETTDFPVKETVYPGTLREWVKNIVC